MTLPYDQIDRPYNSYLTRSVTNGEGVQVAGGEASSGDGSPNDAGGTENTETSSDKVITSGQQFGDIILENVMQSSNYLPKTRGFIIDAQKGYIEATDVYLVGSITATEGYIGGFVIKSTYIADVADSFGLSSVVSAGDDVRFWAGATFANRATAPVRLTESGVLSLGAGTPYLTLDGPNAQIGTSTFVSGQTGWRIDSTGSAEFNNIVARGEFRTAVFVKDEIHATGGTMVVLSSSVLYANFTSVTSPATASLDVKDPPSGHAQLFTVGDILRIKDGSGNDNWLEITAASDQTTFYRYTVVKKSGSNATFYEGTAVVNYQQSTDGFILLTSDLTNAPYIDIGISGATPWTSTTPKARLGNLGGITSVAFGALSGFGIWTENGYFEGSISGSEITGGTIQTSTSGTRVIITDSDGTDDSGAYWKLTALGDGEYKGVAVSSDGHYVTAVDYGGKIWVSSDYGLSFIEEGSALNWTDVAMSATGQYQTACVDGDKIYRSADYGANWTDVGSSKSWSGVSMSSDGQYQTACIISGYLYISSDYGATWSQVGSELIWYGVAVSGAGDYQLAVTFSGVYVSNNYGATWTSKYTTVHSFQGVSISQTGKYQTAVGSRIHISDDYGETWSVVGSASDYLDCCMSSDGSRQTAVGGLIADYIYISDDYGATWTQKATEKNWYSVECAADYSVQVAGIADGLGTGTVYRSINSGISSNSFSILDRESHAVVLISHNNPMFYDKGPIFVDIDEDYSNDAGNTRAMTITRDQTSASTSLVRFETLDTTDTGVVLSLSGTSGRNILSVSGSGSGYAGAGEVKIISGSGGYGLKIEKSVGTYGLYIDSSVAASAGAYIVYTGNEQCLSLAMDNDTFTRTYAPLRIDRYGDGSDYRPMISINNGGNVIWHSATGATPHGNLSGVAGDICIILGAAPMYCTGTTNWTAM